MLREENSNKFIDNHMCEQEILNNIFGDYSEYKSNVMAESGGGDNNQNQNQNQNDMNYQYWNEKNYENNEELGIPISSRPFSSSFSYPSVKNGTTTENMKNKQKKKAKKVTTTTTSTKKRKRIKKTAEEKSRAEREKIRKKKYAKIISSYDKRFKDLNKKTKTMFRKTKGRIDFIEKNEKEMNEKLLPLAVLLRDFNTALKPFQMKPNIEKSDSVDTLNMYKSQISNMFDDLKKVVEESNKIKTRIIHENSKTLRQVAEFGKKLDQMQNSFLTETSEIFNSSNASRYENNTNNNNSIRIGNNGYGALPEITCPTCYELNTGRNLTLLDSLGIDHPFVEQDKLRGVPRGGLITSPLDHHKEQPKKRVKKGSALAAKKILDRKPSATELLNRNQKHRQMLRDREKN